MGNLPHRQKNLPRYHFHAVPLTSYSCLIFLFMLNFRHIPYEIPCIFWQFKARPLPLVNFKKPIQMEAFYLISLVRNKKCLNKKLCCLNKYIGAFLHDICIFISYYQHKIGENVVYNQILVELRWFKNSCVRKKVPAYNRGI